MITRSSIAFEDFLGSSIAPQVMPPWLRRQCCLIHSTSIKQSPKFVFCIFVSFLCSWPKRKASFWWKKRQGIKFSRGLFWFQSCIRHHGQKKYIKSYFAMCWQHPIMNTMGEYIFQGNIGQTFCILTTFENMHILLLEWRY